MMNLKIIGLATFIAICVSPASPLAVAQDQAAKMMPVTVSTSIETELFRLAQTNHLNVVADATHFDAISEKEVLDPAIIGPPTSASLILVPYAQSYHLSTIQSQPNTFLFWPEPDSRQIALAVAHGEGYGVESSAPSADDLGAALLPYFKPNAVLPTNANMETPARTAPELGQDGNNVVPVQIAPKNTNGPTPPPVKFSELSADVQRLVASYVVDASNATMFGSAAYGATDSSYSELWLRDEIWPKVRVVYQPPLSNQRYASLLLQYVLQTASKRTLVSLNLLNGDSLAQKEAALPGTATVKAAAQVEVGPGDTTTLEVSFNNRAKLQVKSPTGAEDAEPVVVHEVLRPSGSSLKALNAVRQNSIWQTEGATELQTPVSLEVTRQPLTAFLVAATQGGGVHLQVAPEVVAEQHLISAHFESMKLVDVMTTVSELYGLTWKKDSPASYTLMRGDLSEFERTLLQIGDTGWYQVRQKVVSSLQKQRVEFNQFASALVNEAGPGILAAPGVKFTALSAESQQEVRARAEAVAASEIVKRQTSTQHLLEWDWVLQWVEPKSTLFSRLPNPSFAARTQFAPHIDVMRDIDGKLTRICSLPVPISANKE